MRAGLLRGDIPVGRMRRFTIRDPKPRLIHAPCFRERVLHHAIMAHVGPVLDRSLVDQTYACRQHKGALAEVKHAQSCLRRGAWFCQIDIRQYFPSISHDVLLDLLSRKFSDHDLLHLLERIVRSYQDGPGRGLPIGALTSQNFANFYLAVADRRIMEHRDVVCYVRYMDDLVWWGATRQAVREVLCRVQKLTSKRLKLEIKSPVRVGRSRDGLAFCGYLIFPDRLLLSRRRKRRYALLRKQAEQAFAAGEISTLELQQRYAAALAITRYADALGWRRAQLQRHPLVPATMEI